MHEIIKNYGSTGYGSTEVRNQGIQKEKPGLEEFVSLLNKKYPDKYFYLEYSTEKVNKRDKIDCYLREKGDEKLRIPLDFKTSKDSFNFSITIISNHNQYNYFKVSKADYLLFSGEKEFYLVPKKSLKKWFELEKLQIYPTKNSGEDSQYFWVNIDNMKTMENIKKYEKKTSRFN